ncbi:FHA domain-containing protein [Hyalangium minutum]|uniref:Adenylate cyclase n=1 Tax=Hyalangium minutum TaxID=394096 RepID=A0A085WA89_9BACT|nr:FHA domain-containing protein [Hyalangium minutum]KFE64602.1 Adenylate cyclase [Hyalangium minutum]
MHFEFEHLGTATPFELTDGQHLLGGGPNDHVRLEALPPSFLKLTIEGSRLTVGTSQTFTVNGVLVPPGVPRLVLPGEVVGLPEDMRLKILDSSKGGSRGMGTVAVLKHLLTDGDGLVRSRAATLTCLTGLDVGRTFPLAEEKTDIGRGAQMTFRLRDRTVSRSHGRVLRQGAQFTLVALNSPNGVYLNGRRVQGSELLSDGDVIEMGKTLLRFQAAVEEPPPASEPSADSEPAPLPAELSDMSPPPMAETAHQPSLTEWWLIGLGVASAVAGVLVTYALVG